MATNNLTGENIVLPIYNQDGTSFNGLVLKKSVYESIVMSLGDKITGDVYYPNNALVVTMGEYVEYNGVRYVLVNPPVIVREGMVSDNGELKGMTKYSFTFYHPMYMLGNFPFCDVAVSVDQQRYLSENKTFAWIGNLVDYVAKINKNLESTEWYCVIGDNVQTIDRNKLSEVESFDKNTIAEALKRGYEIWEIPYIISTIASTDPLYAQGKRYLIQYGLPTTEILVENEQHELVPFVFHFGQGVGLKNNSRTPRNNKIVTRIAGYGSEDNIPYGYPQIPYEGGTCQYPLYYGIVGGQRVQLIKHPFTRTHLMPPIYRETVNKKVNPMAVGYDPTIEIKDYYDADSTYENPIKPEEPSYEIHEFEKIKPEFGDNSILGVVPVSNDVVEQKYSTMSSFLTKLRHYMQQTNIDIERHVLNVLYDKVQLHVDDEDGRTDAKQYYFHYKIEVSGDYEKVVYESSNINFEETILLAATPPAPAWDDEMDDDGNYKQSYFKITIPQLSFDVYASAAVTQEMTVNMRSGACLGCSFPVMVDWDDYKRNFFDEDGNFAPNGEQRDLEKYPNSQSGQIELTLQKETNTFGTLMPNIYQKPAAGDKFVFLGISMPTSYITAAESRLETDMKQYMRDNNVHYFDYPLKFDEKFLVDNIGILNQMQNNVVVRFDYAGEIHALYIKQISVKYENKPLPTYDITLTDDIEIVLNPIGQVTDDVSKLRLALGGGGVGGSVSGDYIRKDIDDTAYGLIRLIKGMQVGERFVTGLLGEGGMFRKESDGTTYLECDKLYVRMRAYFDTVEIRKYIHSGGNRIASLAGIKCSRVEYIDENGNVTNDASDAVKFRCFFRANNDGQEVTNDFVVGDLAFCKETNANEAQGVEQHGYWRAVVGRNTQGVLTSDGEGWIDLSATDCLSGSDVPIAQDDIIQLGNKTDTTRQGAIIEFVGGADAPSYQIYQGINDYSLNGKNYIGLGYSSQNARAYLNVYGDAYVGDPNESTYIKYNAGTRQLEIKAKISSQSTIDGETIAQFISENTWTEEQIDALITAETDPLSDAIDEIRRQVDGSISTWFYDGVPTLSNLPASAWDTADKKNEHLGDLYYDNLTGYCYRFKYDELNRQWLWGRITDTDVTKALADAAKAQDTADHKRRVFVVQPTPPYDAGDLWVNATYPSGNTETNELQSRYYNDVLRCNTSKAEGTTFTIADWSLASKYTDDKALNDFKANQYVQQLTNGTISTNINNAQTSADNAQSTANGAATAAANAQAAAQAAEAHAATLDYVKTALKQDTVIEGGLVLSTLIALRDGSNHIWSGISGTYQSAETGTGYKGHGIAAWYGGAMVDKEVTTTATDYAKSLFRFDGSGYVAGGNLSWDKNGNVTIQGYSINATTLQVGGSNVATQAALANYVTIATAQTITGAKTFGTSDGSYIQIGAIRIVYDQSNNALKIVGSDGSSSANLYATGGVSALGQSSSGGGGIDMAAVWTALGNATSEQINASHLSTALSAYNPTSNFKTINGNSIIGTGNIVIQGGGGTVTAVKVGSTSYSPTDGVVSLPAYPTTLPASDVSAWAKASTKPSYNLDEISDGSTRKLANYLPLSGGTLTSSSLGVLTLNSTYATETGLEIKRNGTTKAWFGYQDGSGTYMFNNARGKYLTYGDNGVLLFEGQTVYHSGNLPAYPTKSSWNYDDRYLSLSGGTITSTTINVVNFNSSAGYETGITFQRGGNIKAWMGYMDGGFVYMFNAQRGNYLKYHDNGTLTFENQTVIHSGNIGSQSVSYASSAGSASYATSSGNATSATQLQYSRTIWGQSFNGTGNVSGAMSSVTSIDSLLYFDTTNNRIGINTSAPIDGVHLEKKNVLLQNTSSNDGIWVELKGVSEDFGLAIGSGDTNRGIIDFKRSGWMIYFDASNTYCEYGNFVCSGGVTALSDVRHKSIVDDTNITVEQIARMRSVKFLWSDGRDDDNIYVGSIAQDWQSILPEVVLRKDDKDGTLSLNYGVAALVSVITTARKVVDHERRIRELENENKRLKQMLNAA